MHACCVHEYQNSWDAASRSCSAVILDAPQVHEYAEESAGSEMVGVADDDDSVGCFNSQAGNAARDAIGAWRFPCCTS